MVGLAFCVWVLGIAPRFRSWFLRTGRLFFVQVCWTTSFCGGYDKKSIPRVGYNQGVFGFPVGWSCYGHGSLGAIRYGNGHDPGTVL